MYKYTASPVYDRYCQYFTFDITICIPFLVYSSLVYIGRGIVLGNTVLTSNYYTMQCPCVFV